MNRPALLVFSALLACPSAIAQGVNYNYRYGDSRIIIQSETGLVHPSATYIGPGTFSKSAQGIPENGPQANPGLPKVNAGGFIGTPGDNLYGNNPIRAVEAKKMVRQPVRVIYVQPPQPQVRQPREYAYTPGQNSPLQYGGGGTDTGVHIDSSGAASYGSVGERHF
ncbi:MAG: hypothetical protein C5B53_09240 [Candidatus Melainabacteria bacterium]|nr:MAG: hypothetical protein C5B53_09240 [Candidatus Melainabacteria bacterium]